MPVYVDPNNPDCSIECDGEGGASFLAPFECFTWCDDEVEVLVARVGQSVGLLGWSGTWRFNGTLRGVHINRIASTLMRYDPHPVTRSNLTILRVYGEQNPSRRYRMSWSDLPIYFAIEVILIHIRAAIELD